MTLLATVEAAPTPSVITLEELSFDSTALWLVPPLVELGRPGPSEPVFLATGRGPSSEPTVSTYAVCLLAASTIPADSY